MSELCLSCGMCCDGTLGLDCADVTSEEKNRLSRRLQIFEIAGQPALRLPCPAHSTNGCTIYRERPQTCERYRCNVLKAVDAGMLPLNDALELVAQTKAAASKVRARVPGNDGLRRDLWNLTTGIELTLEWKRENAELLMEAAILRRLSQRFDDKV